LPTRRIGSPPQPHAARDCATNRAAEFVRPGRDRSRGVALYRAQQRPPGHAADAELHRAALVGDGRNGDDGKIAVAARHFVERHALAFDDRETHGRDQLIGRARGGEHVFLKRLRGQHAFAAFF